jgi:hypothetical protein
MRLWRTSIPNATARLLMSGLAPSRFVLALAFAADGITNILSHHHDFITGC